MVVLYMDDVLLLAVCREKMTRHILGLVFLPEHLGFVVNSKKSVLFPTQKIKFLSLSIETMLRKIKLPYENMKKIRAEFQFIMNLSIRCH